VKKIRVRIKGNTPLLKHRMREEELFGLLGTKTEKKKDKEELTPREIAENYAYRDTNGNCVIPTAYIVGAFRAVASEYKQKNSQRKSLKAIAGGIFRPCNEFAPLLNGVDNLKTFEVDIRKATNHQKGAVAVCRPRFDQWESEFDVMINDDLISTDVVLEVLNDAGLRSGIGSFRVSKGGYFGQFQVTSWTDV